MRVEPFTLLICPSRVFFDRLICTHFVIFVQVLNKKIKFAPLKISLIITTESTAESRESESDRRARRRGSRGRGVFFIPPPTTAAAFGRGLGCRPQTVRLP